MLYPTVDSLVEMKHEGEAIGNRYRLVNVTAKLAREIADAAAKEGEMLDDKPVKLAVYELIRENGGEPELPPPVRREREKDAETGYDGADS